ncbi:MAG: hypothetical protein WBA76_18390 [Phormidesmis sp.]
MTSISIQARIDSAVWEAMKADGETNTQVLQRISIHYLATSGDELSQIAPTPAAAVAVLFNSHRLLNQLLAKGAIALPETSTAPAQQVSASAPEAAQSADNW